MHGMPYHQHMNVYMKRGMLTLVVKDFEWSVYMSFGVFHL